MPEKTYKKKIGGKELTIQLKDWTEQANGSALARCGDTVVLATATMGEEKDFGFFPLTVDYEEKFYAAGAIKGSRFTRREGRPSDEAVCNARLIDRTIRPRFPKSLSREIQVIATIFAWDDQNDPDVLAMVASSVALGVSDIPWHGPISAVRICRTNGKFILNPSYQEREGNDLDIVFAGIVEGKDLLVNMIEGELQQTKEQDIMEALKEAEAPLRELFSFQQEIIQKEGKKKIDLPEKEKDKGLEEEINAFLKDGLEKAIYQKDKTRRENDLSDLKKELTEYLENNYPEDENKIKYASDYFDQEIDRLIHENIIKYEKRPDGRKIDEIRDISCQTGLLPRSHGSGLFCRGKTKALSFLTLGGPGDCRLIEGMEITKEKRFMHHYNFPPYSAGEAKPLRGPGRREIGHGHLAEKAVQPVIPPKEEFPYAIRIVTEILSSNGSTSMASVSGISLSLMDAGVPIRASVAGIAVGLIRGENGYKVLTDIQGPEDHHGDMDFKVAGTSQGVTAIQMDVKIDGIDAKIIEEALERAKKAREHILSIQDKTIKEPKKELSPYAPRIERMQINPEKIGTVIGPGGSVIKEIIEKTGATIDIEDSGEVFITAKEAEAADKAIKWIKGLTKEVEQGEILDGEVKKTTDFGAFVEVLPGQDGLIHISKLAEGRVEKVEDVVKVGDIVTVKVISVDEQNKISLKLLKNKGK
jgi:polyribonucleotide nucleotidyltransferase